MGIGQGAVGTAAHQEPICHVLPSGDEPSHRGQPSSLGKTEVWLYVMLLMF